MKAHQIFFFLLLVFLPTQLGYHFWPAWTNILGRNVDYLAPTLYLTDILVVLTLVSYRRLPRIWPAPFVFLALFAVINTAFAARWQVAAYGWLKILEFGLLGWYIVRTNPAPSLVVRGLSWGVLYSSSLAIAQAALQHSVGGPLWFLGERTFSADTPGIARAVIRGRELLRPYATFPHPNVLGGFLAVTMPLLLSARKKAFRLPVILGSVALLLSMSRSAIFAGALGSALAVQKKFRVPLRMLSAAIAVVFVVSLSSADESVLVRGELLASAIRIWQESPLFGVGLGNFLIRLPEALTARQIYFLQPVHNIYLLVLAEAGITGILLIVLFAARSIRRQASRIRRSPYAISLVSMLLLGLVDHYPLTLQQGQLLFTILLSATIASCVKPSPSTPRHSLLPRAYPQARRLR